jgi:hypothetical protein
VDSSLATSTLKMEVISSSKMLATTYKITWYHNTEDHNPLSNLNTFLFLIDWMRYYKKFIMYLFIYGDKLKKKTVKGSAIYKCYVTSQTTFIAKHGLI